MRDARQPQFDYAAEADVRAACDRAGVLQSAQDDFIAEFRSHYFKRNEIEKWIESKRADKPQRWVIAGTEDHELFANAFGPVPNYTSQAAVVTKYGEERAAEIAEQFGTKLGGKPGTVPEGFKTNANGDHTSNPWARLKRADGSTDADAATEIDGIIKRLGTVKAAAIARAAGKTITGVPLR
jgi:hypothetical protein